MRNVTSSSKCRQADGARPSRAWLGVVLALFTGLAPALSAALERHGVPHPPSAAQQLDPDGAHLLGMHFEHCLGHQSGCQGVGLGILPHGAEEPETAQGTPAESAAGPGVGRLGGRLDHPPRAAFVI